MKTPYKIINKEDRESLKRTVQETREFLNALGEYRIRFGLSNNDADRALENYSSYSNRTT